MSYGKKSILTDSTLSEAYRLIYWGNYFSIVEIFKQDSMYLITADSSSWGKRNYLVYRRQDTLLTNSEIYDIYKYCDEQKEAKEIVNNSEDEEATNDDRDNWAFEYKLGDYYRTMEGIETPKELESIYVKIMRLGGLAGFRIYLNVGGFNDY